MAGRPYKITKKVFSTTGHLFNKPVIGSAAGADLNQFGQHDCVFDSGGTGGGEMGEPDERDQVDRPDSAELSEATTIRGTDRCGA